MLTLHSSIELMQFQFETGQIEFQFETDQTELQFETGCARRRPVRGALVPVEAVLFRPPGLL